MSTYIRIKSLEIRLDITPDINGKVPFDITQFSWWTLATDSDQPTYNGQDILTPYFEWTPVGIYNPIYSGPTPDGEKKILTLRKGFNSKGDTNVLVS